MPTPSAPRWRRTLARALHLRRAEPAPVDLDVLRALCRELVADLEPGDRQVLDVFIGHARCADDIWHLRSQLFGLISLRHGEHVARERLRRLDAHWH
jgi:hypothetical protein